MVPNKIKQNKSHSQRAKGEHGQAGQKQTPCEHIPTRGAGLYCSGWARREAVDEAWEWLSVLAVV